MIGLPTTLARSVVEQIVTGLFADLTLTVRDVKVHEAGEVKAKVLFRRQTVGGYVLDVDINEVKGVLQPGTPELRFSRDRVDLRLPVRLAHGEGNADLRFQWDSKGLVANLVCGDIDTTQHITGGVVPVDYRLEGGFEIDTRADAVTLQPHFPEPAVRIVVAPTEKAWAVVDEVVRDQRKICEIALNKIDIKARLQKVLDKGFTLRIPQSILKPIRLPAGVTQSLDVQGLKLPVTVTFTGVLVAPERIWYGADVKLERLGRDPES